MPQKKLSIRIDGELISALEGQTILQAARANGKSIPTLCDMEGLTPVGGCRLCIVEVQGIDGGCYPLAPHRYKTACPSLPRKSPKLTKYRRMSIELLLVERNHFCAVCVSNGHCELQSMATDLGISSVHFAYNYPKLSVDMSHPRFVLDHNRCILCTRCVRVCAELEGAHVSGNDLARHPRKNC